MKFLDLTFSTPEENLACDEAILEACEVGNGSEVLRFWEPKNLFVVLGYSNKAGTETNQNACQQDRVPVLRRISGGGTVLQGPGCLNYALFLRMEKTPELLTLTGSNRFIMNRHQKALASLLSAEGVAVEGHTDLALSGLKFSGNSQRRKGKFLLFHGTFLLNFDFNSVEKYLRMPSQEPAYRQGRTHKNFLINLKIKPETVKSALKKIWVASSPLKQVPHSRIKELVSDTYSTATWNFKF